jgi:DNA-directed RNA polymerase subunit beta'
MYIEKDDSFIMNRNVISFNKIFDKNELRNLLGWFITNYGSIKTKSFLDRLKSFSLEYATGAGISLGLGDLQIPSSKVYMMKNAESILRGIRKRYRNSKVNSVDIFKRENDIWSIISENLKNEVLNNLRRIDLLNPLYIMTVSGARGNLAQAKQLVGMRGFMSDSQGNVIDLPIKSNFKEGLNIVEYFISCYGARKGLIDTALKTANSGYLTRRLIYAAQGLVINQSNCFTQFTISVVILKKKKEKYRSLKSKLLGRIIAKTIKDEKSGKVLISFGQDICNVRFDLLKL